jgi:hypothetical protein
MTRLSGGMRLSSAPGILVDPAPVAFQAGAQFSSASVH